MPLIDVCQQCDMLEVFDNPVLGEGDNRAMEEKLLQTHQKKLKSNLKLNHKKLTILDKMANGLVNLASAYIADVTSNSLYLTKHQSTDKLEYQSDSPLPTRRHRANSQRKVFFADEMGHALVSVLFVEKEGGEEDPQFNTVTKETKSTTPPVKKDTSFNCPSGERKFYAQFKQPALDRVSFQEQLDCHNCALDTVFIRKGKIAGTIKVKSLSLKMKVQVRISWDQWTTYQDMDTAPLSTASTDSENHMFMFEIKVPRNVHEVQFVVRYQAAGQEFFDNNYGENYIYRVESCFKEETTV